MGVNVRQNLSARRAVPHLIHLVDSSKEKLSADLPVIGAAAVLIESCEEAKKPLSIALPPASNISSQTSARLGKETEL